MINQYDNRHVLKVTDFGKRVLEDAEEEDDVEDNLYGLFPTHPEPFSRLGIKQVSMR
jgi:hypothetical protein